MVVLGGDLERQVGELLADGLDLRRARAGVGYGSANAGHHRSGRPKVNVDKADRVSRRHSGPG
jgi:hypothetical protein